MKNLKEHLEFTKSERTALLTIIVLIICATLIKSNLADRNPITNQLSIQQLLDKSMGAENDKLAEVSPEKPKNIRPKTYPQKKTVIQADRSKSDKFNAKSDSKTAYPKTNKKYIPKVNLKNLSFFDPNVISSEMLLSFGLSQYVVNNWNKYLEKGANFKSSEDIKKIYGLSDAHFTQLKPYIKFNTYKKSKPIVKKDVKIEVNTATKEQLTTVKGIGNYYASRIIKFRDKLGGFYSIDQISQTYGLVDSNFQKFKHQLDIIPLVIKINLNSASKEEFAGHPYISYKEADIIIKYRKQHGFQSVEDIRKIKIFDEQKIENLIPYLTI